MACTSANGIDCWAFSCDCGDAKSNCMWYDCSQPCGCQYYSNSNCTTPVTYSGCYNNGVNRYVMSNGCLQYFAGSCGAVHGDDYIPHDNVYTGHSNSYSPNSHANATTSHSDGTTAASHSDTTTPHSDGTTAASHSNTTTPHTDGTTAASHSDGTTAHSDQPVLVGA